MRGKAFLSTLTAAAARLPPLLLLLTVEYLSLSSWYDESQKTKCMRRATAVKNTKFAVNGSTSFSCDFWNMSSCGRMATAST